MKMEIIVTTQHEGFHNWPDAPQQVAFLRNTHRHMFHFKVGMPVYHADRDLEFFIEQRRLKAVVADLLTVGKVIGSCETIAVEILKALPHLTWAEVWEDGENGVRVAR